MDSLSARNGHSPLLDHNGRPMQDERGLLLPPYRQFSAVYNTISRTYMSTFDEALKHSKTNALAMPRDAFLMGCLQERMLQLAELKCHLKPENEKDSRQKEVARGLTDICVGGCDRWIQFKMQLAWATWYGRYGNQLAWMPKSINGKKRLAVTTHSPVNGDKIQFGWDGVPRVFVNYMWINEHAPKGSPSHKWIENYDEKAALMQKDNPAKPVIIGERAPMLVLKDPLWRERFVIHKHLCIDADYFDGEMAGGLHGVGLRSMVYWFFHLRDEMIGWAINHLQKIGVGGILMFYYDEGNADAQEQAEKAAADAGERYALAMPRPRGQSKDVSMFDYMPFNEAGVTSMTQVIQDYFERHIERLMIGQTLSSKPAGGGLGDGTASLHSDTKHKILMFDAINLQDTLNSDYIPVAKKWNYPKADFNVYLTFEIPDPDAETKLKLGQIIVAVGGEVKADDMLGPAGFEKPEPDDVTFSQAKAQQALAEGQAESQQKMADAQQQQAIQKQQAAVAQAQQKQKAAVEEHEMKMKHEEQKQRQKQELEVQKAQQKAAMEFAKNMPAENETPPLPENVRLVNLQDDALPLAYAAQHAPAGGATINGKKFTGGEFIPAGDMAKATPRERMKLEQKQQAGQPQPQMPQEQPQAIEEPMVMVPPEQMDDVLRFTMSNSVRGKEDHMPHVLDSVRKFANLQPGKGMDEHGQLRYHTAAGRAYQRAAMAASLGQVTQDTYDASAARMIEQFRAKAGKDIGAKTQLQPVSQAARQAATGVGKVAGAMSKPVFAAGIGESIKPFFGPTNAKGKIKDPLSRAVHAAGTRAGAGIASQGVKTAIGDIPHFVHWLQQGMPREGVPRAATTAAKAALLTALGGLMAHKVLTKPAEKQLTPAEADDRLRDIFREQIGEENRVKTIRKEVQRELGGGRQSPPRRAASPMIPRPPGALPGSGPRDQNTGRPMWQADESPAAYNEDAVVEALTDEVMDLLEVE